ncbi:DUF317 domain-containing protein [Streptomyces mirabilis]|nr:DUF317 domain-containing protein [Streptomyces mirabilis]
MDPDPDGQWWTLHHTPAPGRPAWYASFGARTPVEMIGAFLDALTDPNAATAVEADPYEPLRQAGWVPACPPARRVHHLARRPQPGRPHPRHPASAHAQPPPRHPGTARSHRRTGRLRPRRPCPGTRCPPPHPALAARHPAQATRHRPHPLIPPSHRST